MAEYAGSNIPSALNFYTLQIQHNGVLPNLQDPSEREKLRYLLESCPKDIDSSLYLKQFAGRDVLTEYQHTKPITDPKLLELYGQFPVKEMSQIPLQNVNDFLSYLKENDLSVQDVGQITSQMVKNLTVKSNVAGLKNGSFADGNIEFWGSNYGTQNSANIPGADSSKYDFGDGGTSPNSDGYGSMQIHNYKEKQVVFAFNNFRAGSNADIGIGTNRSGHPDYTFSQSMKNYSMALILVLAELE